jgi:hypothetical protein
MSVFWPVMCICCETMKSAIHAMVIRSRNGVLFMGRDMTYYQLAYCPFCGKVIGG